MVDILQGASNLQPCFHQKHFRGKIEDGLAEGMFADFLFLLCQLEPNFELNSAFARRLGEDLATECDKFSRVAAPLLSHIPFGSGALLLIN